MCLGLGNGAKKGNLCVGRIGTCGDGAKNRYSNENQTGASTLLMVTRRTQVLDHPTAPISLQVERLKVGGWSGWFVSARVVLDAAIRSMIGSDLRVGEKKKFLN